MLKMRWSTLFLNSLSLIQIPISLNYASPSHYQSPKKTPQSHHTQQHSPAVPASPALPPLSTSFPASQVPKICMR